MNSLEYKKREKEKKKENLEREDDFKIKIDTKNLLNELAGKIAKEFGIDISKVKELISSKTGSKLEDLKFDVSNKENLLNVISGARDVIEKASRDEINLLKSKIDIPSYNLEDNIYLSDKFIPKNFMNKARNPKNLGDNIIGASIGLINSTEEIIKVLYNIGAGVIKTPYHIYLISTGKAKYEGFKKI